MWTDHMLPFCAPPAVPKQSQTNRIWARSTTQLQCSPSLVFVSAFLFHIRQSRHSHRLARANMSSSSSQAALTWLQQHGSPPTDHHEILALAVHALLLHHGFRPAETPTDAQPTALPSDWGGAGFGGRYRHERSAMTFDIRAVRMGGRLLIHATPTEDDAHLHTVDIRVDEYVTAGDSWTDVVPRLSDLATIIAVQIAHRLVPDATKPGYEHAAAGDQTSSSHGAPASGAPAGGPSAPTPRPLPGPRPIPPGADPLRDDRHDPLRIGPPRRPGGMAGPAIPFGADDLLPPGLQPRPGGMFTPGGNLMGPGHFGRGRGGRFPGGGLPPGVPPGARFDPVYPVPDNDAEMPPGFDDEHGLRQPPLGRGGGRPGGGDDGPPPGMYW